MVHFFFTFEDTATKCFHCISIGFNSSSIMKLQNNYENSTMSTDPPSDVAEG